MEKAIDRQRVLLAHLLPSSSSNQPQQLSASECAAGDSAAYQRSSCFGDDVVIVAAYRTPICKAKRGGFKDTFGGPPHSCPQGCSGQNWNQPS